MTRIDTTLVNQTDEDSDEILDWEQFTTKKQVLDIDTIMNDLELKRRQWDKELGDTLMDLRLL
jgi:hypothetical protein